MELTVVKGGITRLRTKGAAAADSLYDLLNGYVTAAKTVKVRPGTFRHANLDQGESGNPLKGLVAFDGELHVFAASNDGYTLPDGFQLHLLQHPDSPDDEGNVIPLRRIHFASPFMGFLYVVAEFEDTGSDLGTVFHYWLQTGSTWEADKIYKLGDIVTPTVPNGYAYQATRLSAANPSWAPNIPRALGDVVEPTAYNDFYYTVVEALGSNPRSGAVEPAWPTEPGAQINEDAEGDYANPDGTTSQPDPSENPNPDTADRYD